MTNEPESRAKGLLKKTSRVMTIILTNAQLSISSCHSASRQNWWLVVRNPSHDINRNNILNKPNDYVCNMGYRVIPCYICCDPLLSTVRGTAYTMPLTLVYRKTIS